MDDYDPWIGREADEQTLEDARRVMRKRRPDKKHWMLLDSRAEQEAWDANYRSIDPDEPTPLGTRLILAAGAIFLTATIFMSGYGLVAMMGRL